MDILFIHKMFNKKKIIRSFFLFTKPLHIIKTSLIVESYSITRRTKQRYVVGGIKE